MKKVFFCLLLMMLCSMSSVSAENFPELNWTAPVKTVVSTGNTVKQKGTRIDPTDFGIVLLAKNQTGGWFLFEAPQDGDYIFSVRAPDLSGRRFNMRFYFDAKDQAASAAFNKSNEVQQFVLKGVKKGQTVYWWDDDNTGRGYTLLDSHELMITIANQPGAVIEPTAVPQSKEVSPQESFRPGDTLFFGHYEQDNHRSNGPEPIEWQVLAVENGKVLIISKYGLDQVPYNTVNTMSANVSWETCGLREWLNETFLGKAFSTEDQYKIAQVINKNSIPPWQEYAVGFPPSNAPVTSENDTVDRIFLLSKDEAEKYFSSDEDRQCIATAYAEAHGAKNEITSIFKPGAEYRVSWWLRSVLGVFGGEGSWPSWHAMYIFPAGHFYGIFVNYKYHAVRPALWLDPEGSAESPAGLIHPDDSTEGSASSDSGRYFYYCGMKSYLNPGDHAEVAINTGLKMRKKPAGAETGIQAFAGKDVKIMDGPVCVNGVVWFDVDFLGYRGWCMEGQNGTYYLTKTSGPSVSQNSPAQPQKTPEPTAAAQTVSPPADKGGSSAGQPAYPTLRPGDTVEIINIPSLKMYMSPNRNPIDGVVAFPGKTAKITDGPQYDSNVYWYEINFLGYTGWVMGMSISGVYYLEKIN